MDELESMLDQGKSFSTMSDLAKQLKISLRTLYEIAPSKEELIVTTVDRVLKKHGKIAMDAMNAQSTPIRKLESFLAVANQAVGPRLERFTQPLNNLNSSKQMVDYHEQYITMIIKNLLDEAKTDNEITLSLSFNFIPFIPLEERPLNNLNFFDLNLMHLPLWVLNKTS